MHPGYINPQPKPLQTAMELYDPVQPAIKPKMQPLQLPSPPPQPNPLAAEMRKDAESFDRKMRETMLKLDATRAREISSGANYLKAAELGDDDRLDSLHDEVEALKHETKERFTEMRDMLHKHHAFLTEVAAALEK